MVAKEVHPGQPKHVQCNDDDWRLYVCNHACIWETHHAYIETYEAFLWSAGFIKNIRIKYLPSVTLTNKNAIHPRSQSFKSFYIFLQCFANVQYTGRESTMWDVYLLECYSPVFEHHDCSA